MAGGGGGREVAGGGGGRVCQGAAGAGRGRRGQGGAGEGKGREAQGHRRGPGGSRPDLAAISDRRADGARPRALPTLAPTAREGARLPTPFWPPPAAQKIEVICEKIRARVMLLGSCGALFRRTELSPPTIKVAAPASSTAPQPHHRLLHRSRASASPTASLPTSSFLSLPPHQPPPRSQVADITKAFERTAIVMDEATQRRHLPQISP